MIVCVLRLRPVEINQFIPIGRHGMNGWGKPRDDEANQFSSRSPKIFPTKLVTASSSTFMFHDID